LVANWIEAVYLFEEGEYDEALRVFEVGLMVYYFCKGLFISFASREWASLPKRITTRPLFTLTWKS
jgi:hypothetical protein